MRAQVKLWGTSPTGERVPLPIWSKVDDEWRRTVHWVDTDHLTTPGQSVQVLTPTVGAIVASETVSILVSSESAVSITATVGTTTVALERGDTLWTGTVPGLDNGEHTLTVTAVFAGGATVAAEVSFTLNFTASEPTGPGEQTSDIWFSKPNLAAADVFVQGGAFAPEVKINSPVTSLGVAKVEWQYGSILDVASRPEFGWRTMTYNAAADAWRSDTTIDTRRHLIGTNEVGSTITGSNPPVTITEQMRLDSLVDPYYDMGARVTLTDGSVLYSDRIRVISNNRSPRREGTTPTWKAKFAWSAEYANGESDDMARREAYLRKLFGKSPYSASPTGIPGTLNGKEPQAFSIVPDPVMTGTNGHINHGNVFEAHIPLNYHEITKNRDSYWKPKGIAGSYGSNGDQPNSSYRSQLVYPGRLTEGDMVYVGRSIRLAPDFPTPKSHLSIGQFFQKDYDWGLAMMFEGKWYQTGHGEPDQADHFKYWGERFSPFERSELLRIPFYRGQWFDLIWGIGVSRDARKGWLEVYTRRPDVNNGALTQHTWPDGSKRLKIALLQEGNVTGEPGLQIHDHIYWGRTLFPGYGTSSNTPARVMFAKQATGPTVESVDPKSYNPEG